MRELMRTKRVQRPKKGFYPHFSIKATLGAVVEAVKTLGRNALRKFTRSAFPHSLGRFGAMRRQVIAIFEACVMLR
jgi:hypothetical protein